MTNQSKPWTYVEQGGIVYPVHSGEVWAVKTHLLVCSDLMATTLYDQVLDQHPDPPTLLYCDPPWGQALANGFRTKAGLPPATYRWESLYRRIATIGIERRLPMWFENSVRESRDGARTFSAIRYPQGSAVEYEHYWEIRYYKRSPCGLYYAGPTPYPIELTGVLAGKDDSVTPDLVLGAYPQGVVIDPCAGLGTTALAAEAQGWASVTNELNPHRMSAALRHLHTAIGLPPRRME